MKTKTIKPIHGFFKDVVEASVLLAKQETIEIRFPWKHMNGGNFEVRLRPDSKAHLICRDFDRYSNGYIKMTILGPYPNDHLSKEEKQSDTILRLQYEVRYGEDILKHKEEVEIPKLRRSLRSKRGHLTRLSRL